MLFLVVAVVRQQKELDLLKASIAVTKNNYSTQQETKLLEDKNKGYESKIPDKAAPTSKSEANKKSAQSLKEDLMSKKIIAGKVLIKNDDLIKISANLLNMDEIDSPAFSVVNGNPNVSLKKIERTIKLNKTTKVVGEYNIGSEIMVETAEAVYGNNELTALKITPLKQR